jgi:hypothetical protein
VPRPSDPYPPPIVDRYLARVAALDAAAWGALAARHRSFEMSIAGLARWWRTARRFHAALRQTSIPARIAATHRLNAIIGAARPAPASEATKAVRDGLYGLLTREVVAAEAFEQAYAPVAAVIPLESIA